MRSDAIRAKRNILFGSLGQSRRSCLGRTGRASSLIALFAAMVGCSAHDAEGQAAADAPLLLSNPDLWSGHEVPYCFVAQGISPMMEQRKQDFRDALAQSWGAERIVRFSERACDGNTVQVSFQPLNGYAGVAGLGRRGGIQLGMQLDTGYLQRPDPGDFKWVVAHEMGHVLGFGHEQDQRDSTCNQGRDYSGNGTPLTAYDPNSVMNYCATRNVNAILSAADKEGFRRAYGVAPPPPPGNPGPQRDGETQPIHRAHNPEIADHLQGLTPNEGAPWWQYEGVSFRTWRAQPGNGIPLFRCRLNDTANHFLSSSDSCEGHVNEGHLGFVSTVPAPDALPIFRCVSGLDHLSTLSPDECIRAGFAIEGMQGFALP